MRSKSASSVYNETSFLNRKWKSVHQTPARTEALALNSTTVTGVPVFWALKGTTVSTISMTATTSPAQRTPIVWMVSTSMPVAASLVFQVRFCFTRVPFISGWMRNERQLLFIIFWNDILYVVNCINFYCQGHHQTVFRSMSVTPPRALMVPLVTMKITPSPAYVPQDFQVIVNICQFCHPHLWF